LQAIIAGTAGFWTQSGSNIYSSNSGNVGIGTNSPTSGKLQVQATGRGIHAVSTGEHAVVGTGPTSGTTYYGVYGQAGSYYGALGRQDGYSFVGSGTLYNNGTVYGSSFLYLSDARLKSDVQPLDNGLVTLMKLRPVSFTWNKDVVGEKSGSSDIGFIAQEVAKLVPEAVVQESSSGMYAVDYPKLVPVLVQAIQEQQKQIDSLRAEIAALKAN
jgi:hypothetical protein